MLVSLQLEGDGSHILVSLNLRVHHRLARLCLLQLQLFLAPSCSFLRLCAAGNTTPVFIGTGKIGRCLTHGEWKAPDGK